MNAPACINTDQIIATILRHFPQTEAIYLFGSHASATHTVESDLDLAVLLPMEIARTANLSYFSPLHDQLVELTQVAVDCINLRLVSTVFQYEIIGSGIRIYCRQFESCTAYEALVLSLYQKLNEERADIIRAIYATGRVLAI
jgi:predicted nucleotidyltransferase